MDRLTTGGETTRLRKRQGAAFNENPLPSVHEGKGRANFVSFSLFISRKKGRGRGKRKFAESKRLHCSVLQKRYGVSLLFGPEKKSLTLNPGKVDKPNQLQEGGGKEGLDPFLRKEGKKKRGESFHLLGERKDVPIVFFPTEEEKEDDHLEATFCGFEVREERIGSDQPLFFIIAGKEGNLKRPLFLYLKGRELLFFSSHFCGKGEKGRAKIPLLSPLLLSGEGGGTKKRTPFRDLKELFFPSSTWG